MEFDKMPEDATGKWVTTTRNGTTHEWDFDEMTITRHPHAKSHNYGMGPNFNNKPQPIRSVVFRPEVGNVFLVTLWSPESTLQSSTVVKIEKVD